MTERLASIAELIANGVHDVVFNCGACCKHMAHYKPIALAVAFGEDTRLDQIAARGRCKGCGVRGRLWFEVLAKPSGRGGFGGLSRGGNL